MEEKHIDLLVSITGLDKEFITNSLKNEEGTTIVLNQFREKNKVFKIEDWNKRELNIKTDIEANHLTNLIELARTQKLPSTLYNAVANNIISSHNKTLSADFGIELEDYSNIEAFKTAVKEKLTKVDNTQLQSDFNAQAQTIKDFQKKFEDQEETHKQAMKKNNINIVYSKALNDFPIDFETEEELKSRRTVADSVFNNMYEVDIIDGKTIVKDKEGNVLKNDTTKETLTIQTIFDTEISKYVPVKKERASSERKPGDPIINTGVITREAIDKQIESGELKPHSNEHVALEKKLLGQK